MYVRFNLLDTLMNSLCASHVDSDLINACTDAASMR